MNPQNKYSLTKSLGLGVCKFSGIEHTWISADDLESLLQKATVVYGSVVKHKDEYEWAQDLKNGDTHTGLLIGIKPIKEKTLAEKISETIEKYFESNLSAGAPVLLEIKKLIEAENE